LTGSGRVFYDARWEVAAMTWETPSFIEVKMDAEINSYQDDFDREDNGI
jgi:coenzyme PQQ precursor peptide PqqA